jgi:hypothetical protein
MTRQACRHLARFAHCTLSRRQPFLRPLRLTGCNDRSCRRRPRAGHGAAGALRADHRGCSHGFPPAAAVSALRTNHRASRAWSESIRSRGRDRMGRAAQGALPFASPGDGSDASAAGSGEPANPAVRAPDRLPRRGRKLQRLWPVRAISPLKVPRASVSSSGTVCNARSKRLKGRAKARSLPCRVASTAVLPA